VPSSVRSLETCLLERQLDLSALFGVLAPAFLKSRQRRFDAEWLDALDDFGSDRGVDAKTAEGDAALGTARSFRHCACSFAFGSEA
jgi:hypothetical protein